MSTALAIVAAVLGVSLLIVVHELGHHLAALRSGMRVERFSVGFGPVVTSFRRWGTEFAISALPLGGYVKIAGMAPGDEVAPDDPASYANQPAWRRFGVILAGPAMNYVTAVVLAAVLLATIGLRGPDASARVGTVLAGWPAAEAGLKTDDRILSVDGAPVADWAALVARFQGSPGRPLTLEIERGEGAAATRTTVVLTPRDVKGRGRVGVGQGAALQREAGLAAVTSAFARTNAFALAQLAAFGAIFKGAQGAELSGPIGIAQQLVSGARDGAAPFMALVWQISIVLAILNLLPVPALDGGRLVFLLIEMVTRRRVNERVESVVHFVGFVLLVALLLGVTVFGDLARLLGR
ncbi:MAG: M50 family metallopeptidase [Anaeromyxobacteraceae bacterium]